MYLRIVFFFETGVSGCSFYVFSFELQASLPWWKVDGWMEGDGWKVKERIQQESEGKDTAGK